MSRVLVVAEAGRSHGEFRRPWVRAVYATYVRRYRATVAAAVAGVASGEEVTLLAGRELVDRASLPPGIELRLYDEESFKADARPLADLTTRIVEAWWPARASESDLHAHGVWLPDLLPVAKGILLRLELIEYLGAVEGVIDEVTPQRVVLVTGASVPEQLARAVAATRRIRVEIAHRFTASPVLASVWRLLRTREQRRGLRTLLTHPRRSRPAGRTRFLFSVCHPRHLLMVEPLAMALRHADVTTTLLVSSMDGVGLDAKLGRLTEAGVSCASFMDYLPRSEAQRTIRLMRPVVRRLLSRLATEPENGAGTGSGDVRLWPMLAPFARDAVRWNLRTARLYLEAAVRTLDELRPAAVIVASDRRFAERALALAARARGIPTMLCWGSALLARDRTNTFGVTDRILLIGDHVRAALVEQGLDPARLTVVGDPRSNAARLVPRDRLRADVVTDFRLALDRPLFVLVSKYVSILFSVEEKEAFYRTVRAAVRQLGDPNVVVKVHPNEDLGLLREQVRAWGWPDAVLTQSYDIHRLFRAADAALMVTSMAGIEAMAMECPVVAVQTRDKDFEGRYMPPYVSDGAVERVDMNDPAALAAALRRLLTDPVAREELVERGRKFAAGYVHPVDGGLTERLLGTVDEIRAEVAAGRPR